MSYNSNSSSSESNNKMETNSNTSQTGSTPDAKNNTTPPQTNVEQIEMTSGNSNNNVSMDSASASMSSCSKLTNTSPSISTKTSSSSSSLCNSNKSSSSSDENNRKLTPQDRADQTNQNTNINSCSSNDNDDDDDDNDLDEENTHYNSSNQSDEYRGEPTSVSRSSGNGNLSDSNRNANDGMTDLAAVPHTVSAYERLTKSVRSFLNATRILRSQFTNASPESSANEESSSANNQSSSLSPFSSTSSASPPSSSSPSQSGLSPPSISSSNQSSSSSSLSHLHGRLHHHHFHHHHHHHHASSSSNSDKVKNMTKKSNLFDELLKQCSMLSNENTSAANAKKPSQKVNKTNLKNLISLFKNNENYYTTMFFPITDNFKLESSKTRYAFRASTARTSRRASKKEAEVKSNGEDSNDLNEVELAYKQQNQLAADNTNNNNSNNNNITNSNITESSPINTSNNSNNNESATTSSNNSTSNNNTNTSTNSTSSTNISPTSSNSSSNTNSNSGDTNSSPTTSTSSATSQSHSSKSSVKYKSLEFFTCPICCHCLYEPITLICGCTFCKSCLNEFNLTSLRLSLIKLAKKNAAESLHELDLLKSGDTKKPCITCSTEGTSSSSLHKGVCGSDDENSSVTSNDDNSNNANSNSSTETSFKGLSCRSLGLFKCFNCSRTHQLNTGEYLKVNTNIASVVEKLFQSKIEIRKLRNDIRRYVVLNLENNNNLNNKTKHFDVNKYEKMFLHAYNLDKTNHLILADLFMINYFSGLLDKAFEYAKKTIDLRPKWAFAYFMKSIYYQKVGDLGNLRSNLIQSYQLDSTIEQIRYKIFQINYIILKPNHSQITDNKTAMAYLKSKELLSLKKSDISAIKRSFSFNNNPEVNMTEAATSQSKYPKVQTNVSFKKRYHSSENEAGKSFNSSNNNLSYDFKSNESINTDENETNESNEDSKQLKINPNLITTNDLECSLCYRLFYNPVTTPCGHSYCCSCLERSLDYQDKCPLCKNSLTEYLAERRQCPTLFLDLLIKNYFSKEYESRKKQYLDELKELTNNENEIPVFVCTTALPFASCPLHIYEPRYRLMLRRAIETGSRQFGMCMYSEMTPYHYTEYGCMLEIRSYQFTRDGRAVVATLGGRRFRVVRAYMKDGYNVAQIEWVTDVRETNEEEIQELQSLHDKTYQLALKWYRLIPEVQKQKILEIYGEMPAPEADIQSNDNGPVWHWFLLNILPLENDFQYKFLTKTSLKERLKQIKKLLIFMLLIDRSRQQMTPSTQNLFALQDGDVDSTQTTSAEAFASANRRRSADEVGRNQEGEEGEEEE